MIKLSPSSAPRRAQCPGSLRLEEQYPDIGSVYSREGTAAHWVALQVLTEKPVITNDKTPNGELVTNEMIEGAAFYRDYINENIKTEKYSAYYEIPLIMSSVHENAFGTCDCLIFDYENKRLHVFDYKFGHRFVSSFKNWQLIYYAIGAIDTEGFNPKDIILHIVQPRYYGIEGKIRRWEISREALNECIQELKIIENTALSENAPLRTGNECLFCSAKHACPQLQDETAIISDFSYNSSAHDLTPQKLGYELKLLLKTQEIIKARILGLSQEAENLLISGKRVPGFILQAGRSNHVWNKSAEEVIEMGKLLGVDLSRPQEAITPKQAIKASIPEEVVMKYSKIVSGEMKLTEDKKNA